MPPKVRPEFKTSEERSKWIIDNADHWSAAVVLDRRPWSDLYPTQAQATAAARRAANTLRKPVMVYAVCGVESTWVKTIHPDQRTSEGGK